MSLQFFSSFREDVLKDHDKSLSRLRYEVYECMNKIIIINSYILTTKNTILRMT